MTQAVNPLTRARRFAGLRGCGVSIAAG
jgi:hypothetical protein